MSIPEDLRYSEEHEWVKVESDLVRIGITDFAQHQLGDVVYVELPAEGDSFDSMEPFGVIESVKAASDLYAPVTGAIVEVNVGLEDAPELVNEDPYGEGWMLVVEPGDVSEVENLLSADQYSDLIEEEE